MKIDSKDFILILVILSLLLGDLLIYTGILNEFFKDKETLWAGIIAFVGAVVGGLITYYGVKIQIYSREVEVFMSTVSEKLTKLDSLLGSLGGYLDFIAVIQDDPTLHEQTKTVHIDGHIKDFCNSLRENLKEINDFLDYDSKFKIKKYLSSMSIHFMDYEDACKAEDTCRSIYLILSEEKHILYRKYKKYKIRSIL
ncbi:hypothetical protein [Bacillus sp. LBG-1-113]|uniref:hypothetical protein n=1 Tax=Bacillus sp. LBG-1-113 TaxID=2886094 RepID=UPI001E3B6C86|nr:hypothetical protein [Bacillus sp. LBG-1-113]MCC2929091.1 hypothetical protein [Bacillus sp. LBG-1-113]